MEERKSVKFTPRQVEIIAMWFEEPRTAAIAKELNLSEHTILTHLKRMRKKLGVSRTLEVYRHLHREGLV